MCLLFKNEMDSVKNDTVKTQASPGSNQKIEQQASSAVYQRRKPFQIKANAVINNKLQSKVQGCEEI